MRVICAGFDGHIPRLKLQILIKSQSLNPSCRSCCICLLLGRRKNGRSQHDKHKQQGGLTLGKQHTLPSGAGLPHQPRKSAATEVLDQTGWAFDSYTVYLLYCSGTSTSYNCLTGGGSRRKHGVNLVGCLTLGLQVGK